MHNLSTQEVVLSIEKSPLKVVKGIIYQEYKDFFGKAWVDELGYDCILDGKKRSFEKLEKQTKLPRVKLKESDRDLKKIKIFFMNLNVINALEKKFKTKLKFDSADIWIDGAGYKLPPHTDDKRIKLSLQIYLNDNNEGTSLYDKAGNLLYTFPFAANNGYALLNNVYSYHGVEEIEEDGRLSLYVRYR